MNRTRTISDKFEQLRRRGDALLVGAYDPDDKNHKVAFVSDEFTRVFGYTIDDIPDKETWWQLAYPEKSYRTVVERQWELLTEQRRWTQDSPLEMEINITAKDQTEIRATVSAERPNKTVPGHYIITFKTS